LHARKLSGVAAEITSERKKDEGWDLDGKHASKEDSFVSGDGSGG
jgi:hypothetical protein